MEELEALLRDLESSGTPRDPPGTPQKCPRGSPSPTREDTKGQGPEQLYSSVQRPRPPPAAPPPPGLGELERLLRDLSHTQSSIAGELLAAPPEDEPKPGGSPPRRESGTPPGPPRLGGGPPRSAATEELERLMASLAEFHLHKPPPPPDPDPAPGGDLESLLLRLREELRDRGVPTGPGGLCRGCGETITGESVRALGGSWHPRHFLCSSCGTPLGSGGFLSRDGAPLCPPCAPRCHRCHQPVLGAVVSALGRTWHPEHFCCSHCGDVLGDQGFLERGGRPFCPRDFGALFGPRCRGCRGPVLDAFVSALGGLWHPRCFVCQDCGAPFPGDSFFQRGGRPLCQRHFREGEGEGQPWGRG